MRRTSPLAALALLAVGLLCTCRVGAQTAEPAVSRAVIANGVRLLLRPEPTGAFVALTVFVRTDAGATSAQQAVSEIAARSLFYGSENQTYDSVSASIAQVGGALETVWTPDYVAFVCVTVPSQVREAIYFLCEALKNASYTPDALERGRQDILHDRQERDRDPFRFSYGAALRHATGVEDTGDSQLRRVTQEQAAAWAVSHYLPAQTVISVAGRFSPARVQTLFDANLFAYQRTPSARHGSRDDREKTFAPTVSGQSEGASPVSLVSRNRSAYAFVVTSAPAVNSPDYPAFVVLQSLLGGGHASRLFRRLRDTLGLGYDVGAAYHAEQGEPLALYLQWTPDAKPGQNPRAVTALLQAQIETLLREPPDDSELARARRVAMGRDALRHERARDRAFLSGWYETMGLGAAFDADFPRRLAAVSREELMRVARKYLTSRFALTALPPAPQP